MEMNNINAEVVGLFVIVVSMVGAYVSGYFLGVNRTITKIYSELPKKQAE